MSREWFFGAEREGNCLGWECVEKIVKVWHCGATWVHLCLRSVVIRSENGASKPCYSYGTANPRGHVTSCGLLGLRNHRVLLKWHWKAVSKKMSVWELPVWNPNSRSYYCSYKLIVFMFTLPAALFNSDTFCKHWILDLSVRIHDDNGVKSGFVWTGAVPTSGQQTSAHGTLLGIYMPVPKTLSPLCHIVPDWCLMSTKTDLQIFKKCVATEIDRQLNELQWNI